ncbi:DUF1707 SHOCT-like domain-containing protein [Longimicrobium sp.]|jgi:hypothetical protein|uniref:DUF1707 SHOCT-like domain-containing protein n=1 Tax=Longimicrobium sp. TaxID=2029185 RepID=UPI002F93B794
MSQPSSAPVPLERTREQTIQQLCQHYAVDNLTDTGLEERLDRAHAAGSLEELRSLVSDLPVLHAAQSAAAGSHLPATGGYNADSQVIVGIMGGAERSGAWAPAKMTTVIAVMGGVDLDLREARFAPGVTEINILAIMGGVDIVVPPGVHLDVNGIGIMGGFGQKGHTDAPADGSAPVLRISGFAMMGGVGVSVRLPGEKASDAKRRERLSREAAKLASGRRSLGS